VAPQTVALSGKIELQMDPEDTEGYFDLNRKERRMVKRDMYDVLRKHHGNHFQIHGMMKGYEVILGVRATIVRGVTVVYHIIRKSLRHHVVRILKVIRDSHLWHESRMYLHMSALFTEDGIKTQCSFHALKSTFSFSP
jgi:hypothetical protein